MEKLIPLLSKQQQITCIYGMTEILPIAWIDARKKVQANVDGDLIGHVLPNVKYSIERDGELWVA